MRSFQQGSYAPRFFFFSILLFLMCAVSVSGYEVVHYDDFKYTANYSGLVAEHDFFNDAGIQYCTASYGAEHYLLCSNPVSQYTTQKFNQRNSSYCISETGVINGGARNFSVRARVRGGEVWKPYTASDTWRLYASQFNQTSTATYPLFLINTTGVTRMLVYRVATSYTLFSNPINYEWYTFQIDYFTQNNSGMNEVYASNFSVCNQSGSCTSQFNTLSSPQPFNCINTTRTLYRNGYYLDYVMVLAYDAGESPVAITTPIADYYTISGNSMPEFSVTTRNKYDISTNSVMQSITSKCEAATTPELLLSEDECNPLYFHVAASDLESDDIKIALDCGQSEGLIDYYDIQDDFTDTTEELLAKYDAEGCNLSKSSFDAYTQAIQFTKGANCSILASHFSNSFPTEQNYLYPNFQYFMEMRFNLKGNNRQIFQFNALDSDTPIVLGFMYNSTTDKLLAFEGSSCCITPPSLVYSIDNMDNSTYLTLRISLNKDDSEYMYSLRQGSETILFRSGCFLLGFAHNFNADICRYP